MLDRSKVKEKDARQVFLTSEKYTVNNIIYHLSGYV